MKRVPPPGLTCWKCHGLFGPLRPAKITDEGLAHVERCRSLDVLAEAYGHWETVRGIQRWVEDPMATHDMLTAS